MMQSYTNNHMTKYTQYWVYLNVDAAAMVFCARTIWRQLRRCRRRAQGPAVVGTLSPGGPNPFQKGR
jgi:hypothetical protein